MTTAPLRPSDVVATGTRRLGALGRTALTVGVALGALVILQLAFRSTQTFPESWNLHLADPITSMQSWIRDNRAEHWLFTGIITPASNALDSALGTIEDFLVGLDRLLPQAHQAGGHDPDGGERRQAPAVDGPVDHGRADDHHRPGQGVGQQVA